MLIFYSFFFQYRFHFALFALSSLPPSDKFWGYVPAVIISRIPSLPLEGIVIGLIVEGDRAEKVWETTIHFIVFQTKFSIFQLFVWGGVNWLGWSTSVFITWTSVVYLYKIGEAVFLEGT